MKLYDVVHFEANSCLELAQLMSDWYDDRETIVLTDVAYLTEMRVSRMTPSQAQVIFVAIITFRHLPNGVSAD